LTSGVTRQLRLELCAEELGSAAALGDLMTGGGKAAIQGGGRVLEEDEESSFSHKNNQHYNVYCLMAG